MGRGLAPRGQPSVPPSPLMTKDAQVRFVAIALALLTITAAVFAWINFQKERQFETPYDGVWWVEKAGHVQAKRIDADGPGARAGIKTGDLLTAVDDHDVQDVGALTKAAVSRWHLFQGKVQPHPRRHSGSGSHHPRSLRPVAQCWSAAHSPHLSRHRSLRSAQALDSPQSDALLSLLPQLVYLFLVPLHGKAERL